MADRVLSDKNHSDCPSPGRFWGAFRGRLVSRRRIRSQRCGRSQVRSMGPRSGVRHAAGGRGGYRLYSEIFLPRLLPDAALQLPSRAVARNRVIDALFPRFTQTIQMDWFAPGIAATGRRTRCCCHTTAESLSQFAIVMGRTGGLTETIALRRASRFSDDAKERLATGSRQYSIGRNCRAYWAPGFRARSPGTS